MPYNRVTTPEGIGWCLVLMKYRIPHIAVCCSLALLSFTGAAYLTVQSNREVPLGSEKQIKVNLETGFGDIDISKGPSSKAVSLRMESKEKVELDDCFEYTVHDDVGFLNFSTECKPDQSPRKHNNIHIDRLDSRDWQMQFTDAVPLSFDIQLGLGKGNIDLTDLAVNDFSLSCGASSVSMRCDRPNKESIDEMSIEAGVSKFQAYGLCNMRFRHLKFNGGVGSYVLDFAGTLNREVDADIEVGLGSLTVRVPENTGVKIVYEKNWVTTVSIGDGFTKSNDGDGEYFTSNYYSSKGRLNIHIDAGMGSVKIRRGS